MDCHHTPAGIYFMCTGGTSLSIPGFAGLSNKFVFYNSCVLGVTWGLNMDVTSFLLKGHLTTFYFVQYMCSGWGSICLFKSFNITLYCDWTGHEIIYIVQFLFCLFRVVFSSNSMKNWAHKHTHTHTNIPLWRSVLSNVCWSALSPIALK